MGRLFFQSAAGSFGTYDTDWQWPSMTFRMRSADGEAWPAGIYIAALYDVDEDGDPTTDFGRRIVQNQPVYPYQPDSDNMALIVTTTWTPPKEKRILYIVPVATYHAYNLTGGGCFYGYPGYDQQRTVTMRRPGGGLGAFMGEPPDLYDTKIPSGFTSQRQQFGHWDSRFIRWMLQNDYSFDVCTDLDLHAGEIPLTSYRLLVSAGHHEYWSQKMRDNVTAVLKAGRNYACFSGNTCFRPISFGDYRSGFMTSVVKVADHWRDYDESMFAGLSYAYGGGWWGIGTGSFGRWRNTARTGYGYQVANSKHWAFAGTGLADGETFGASDHLVGYEADGIPTNSSFQVLASSPTLTDWDTPAGPDIARFGLLGNDSAPSKRGIFFNAGTTDWPRVLLTNTTVQRITKNVLDKLSAN